MDASRCYVRGSCLASSSACLIIFTFVWTKNVGKAVQRRDKYAKSKKMEFVQLIKKMKKMKKLKFWLNFDCRSQKKMKKAVQDRKTSSLSQRH